LSVQNANGKTNFLWLVPAFSSISAALTGLIAPSEHPIPAAYGLASMLIACHSSASELCSPLGRIRPQHIKVAQPS